MKKTFKITVDTTSKEFMDDYGRENATVVMEPTLNLMGDGVRYTWREIKRIIALSDGDDVIAFALDRQVFSLET